MKNSVNSCSNSLPFMPTRTSRNSVADGVAADLPYWQSQDHPTGIRCSEGRRDRSA